MVTKIGFFGVPRVSIHDVVEGTIALIGSRIFTKSLHKDYGVGIAVKILRRVSNEYTGYAPSIDSYVLDKDVVDLGDFDERSIGDMVSQVIEKGGVAIVIGGDHATSYYALSKTSLRSITWLDAHLDLETSSNVTHASVLRHLVMEKGLKGKVIGFRGYSSFREEIKEADKLGIRITSWPFSDDILIKSLQETQSVSLDTDFFDATLFRATRVPEILGYSPTKFVQILRRLPETSAKYFDITEYCPAIDPGYIHAKILVQILIEIIALFIRSGYG